MTAINCQQTRIETTHRILNGDLNEHGTLFGGRLLEAVDAEASVAAMRVARATLVTAAMDHVQFVKPFHLQDAMIVRAVVTGLGHRSVEVSTMLLPPFSPSYPCRWRICQLGTHSTPLLTFVGGLCLSFCGTEGNITDIKR